MDSLLFFLILIYVAKHIIEIWLLFTYKKLVKGGVILGAMASIDIPFILYLIIKGGVMGFWIVVFVEVTEWLIIPYLTLKR